VADPVASVPVACGPGTEAYVPGSFSRRQWPTGHAMTKARPTTRFSGIVPPPAELMWDRESAESERWSPITQRCPAGTWTVNGIWDGGLPL
jgi:hypothetical protein